MRVIAGKARRIQLKTVQGDATRPTADRIKETLFNILQNDLCGISFLDLFAGSGGIGIEALSRGAASACFVERSRAAADCIRENLAAAHLADQAEILQCDVLKALVRLQGHPPFQIIFMDPPYHTKEEIRVLEYLAAARPSYVDAQTLIIVERALEEDDSELTEPGYKVLRVKTYKTNKHLFLSLEKEKKEQI